MQSRDAGVFSAIQFGCEVVTENQFGGTEAIELYVLSMDCALLFFTVLCAASTAAKACRHGGDGDAPWCGVLEGGGSAVHGGTLPRTVWGATRVGGGQHGPAVEWSAR